MLSIFTVQRRRVRERGLWLIGSQHLDVQKQNQPDNELSSGQEVCSAAEGSELTFSRDRKHSLNSEPQLVNEFWRERDPAGHMTLCFRELRQLKDHQGKKCQLSLMLMLKSGVEMNSGELCCLPEQAKINVLKPASFLFPGQSQHVIKGTFMFSGFP